jgi:hypothetical protein
LLDQQQLQRAATDYKDYISASKPALACGGAGTLYRKWVVAATLVLGGMVSIMLGFAIYMVLGHAGDLHDWFVKETGLCDGFSDLLKSCRCGAQRCCCCEQSAARQDPEGGTVASTGSASADAAGGATASSAAASKSTAACTSCCKKLWALVQAAYTVCGFL